MLKLPSRELCSSLLSLIIATSPMASLAQVSSASANGLSKAATQAVSKQDLRVGQRYYISTDGLNIRSSNSTNGTSNVVGKLSLNDVVEIYDILNEATPLVQVKIIKSASVKADVAAELFVSKDYLSANELFSNASKYFVIQNIATERTRVYERCFETPNCPHKMIMETEMVVGRPEGSKEQPHEFKTWVGHAKISEWVKFYQDGLGHYPHWYKEGQNVKDIPGPITDGFSTALSSRKWMVKDAHGKSTIYGAFGWYAAKLTPQEGVNYQWMHGTIGWGKDGSAAIDLTRGFLMNMFSDPASSGCTRLENRAIAYLRHLLPTGTDIYRVYAKESTREADKKGNSLTRYADKVKKPLVWNYILLTDGAQKSGGLTADAQTIIEKAIPVVGNLLDKGSYEVDQYPNAVGLDYNKMSSSGKSGDRYLIDSGKETDASKFRGYFLVDEGRFIDYQHPDKAATEGKITIGGMADFKSEVPEFLKTSGSHNPPQANFRSSNQNPLQR